MMSRIILAVRFGSGLAIFVAALTSIAINTFPEFGIIPENVELVAASVTAAGGTAWKLLWV